MNGILKRFVVTVFAAGLGCSVAHGSSFKVTAPKYWQKTGSTDDVVVFRNTQSRSNETVVIHAFQLTSQSESFQASLHDKSKELQSARANFMRRLGITNYTVLDIGKTKLPQSKFGFVQTIQSRFLGYSRSEVQVLERQYVGGNKLYIVTYMIDGPALNNRERAFAAMNFFEPIYTKSRMPASEVVSSSQVDAPSSRTEQTDVEAAATIRDLDMNDPVNIRRCESVPEAIRRTDKDTSFSSMLQSDLETPGNCLLGLWDSATGLLSSVGRLLWSMAKYQVSATFASPAEYRNPNSYRNQVHASVRSFQDQVAAGFGIAISELRKDPKEFGKRVASEVWSAAGKINTEFGCMTPAKQTRMICSILAPSIQGGLIAKLLNRTPLSAADSARFAQIVNDAVKAEKALVPTDRRTVELARSVDRAEDGTRTHNFDSGFKVEVSDGAARTAARAGGATNEVAGVERRAQMFSANRSLASLEVGRTGQSGGRLARALARSASGLPDTEGEIIKAVAGAAGTVAALEARVLATNGLSAEEKARLRRDIRAAHARTLEIMDTYPDLKKIDLPDQGPIVSLISRLETAGVPREKIRSELAKPTNTCAVR